MIQELEIIKPLGPKPRPPIHKMQDVQDSSCNSSLQNSSYNSPTCYAKSGRKYERNERTHSSDCEVSSDDTDKEFSETYNSYRSTLSDNSRTSKDSVQHRTNRTQRQPTYTPTSSTSKTISQRKKQSCKEQKRSNWIYAIILLVLPLFLWWINMPSSTGLQNKTANKEKMEEKRESNNNLDRLMESVQLKFENQISNAWNDILAGIHEVLDNPNRPSIIIFFANETNTMNCLAKEIGHVSGLVLGSGSYLTLNPKDFGTDPGELIDKLKIEIDKKKAVVIQDLLNINANAFRALHNFCDRENPLVKKAVYIITMMVDGYQSPQKQVAFIEKQITNKFSNKIDEDVLYPLVTRITDGAVIEVQSEPHMNKCTFV